MRFVALAIADDEGVLGGKAVGLGASMRAGLNVPHGVALDVELVDAIARASQNEHVDDASITGACDEIIAVVGNGRLAVRSSAVGEDSEDASFAGQHLTKLNVVGRDALRAAIVDVWASGRAASALAYRERMGASAEPRVAVVVQQLVVADCAGVMFTINPVNGADERVIEATWGLGEAVVAGIVTPDRWRVGRGGRVLEQVLGEKDIEVVAHGDGVVERAVDDSRMQNFCLNGSDVAALDALATRCESYFGAPSDIEWAIADGELYLLQRRAVTR